MDATVIMAIIISAIVVLGILILVIVLFYYHWRNNELLANFSVFIRENIKLKDEVSKLQEENIGLANELEKTSRKRTRSQSRSKEHTMTNLVTKVVIAMLPFTASTAMAQISQPLSWGGVTVQFPELPPLTVDMSISSSKHAQPSLLQMVLESEQHEDSVAAESIMLRHAGEKLKSQFYLKLKANFGVSGDGLIGIRDYIVRKRRSKSVNPLPPPPPRMSRWR